MTLDQIELFKAFAIILGLAVAGYGYVKGHLKQRRAKSKKLLAFFMKKFQNQIFNSGQKSFRQVMQLQVQRVDIMLLTKNIALNKLLQANAPDNGCTEKIATQIEFICSQVLTDKYDLPSIVLEIGQLMTVIYDWFKDDETFKEQYPNFVKVMSTKNVHSMPKTELV
ncbi:hypothetical protein ACLKMH_16385 [Psychromonas sp. KJ10-10]|uniref:hypothetical protein n=1 Tax=Psychromonas sp. KJ10-10 TaxID=3391823 RepID=UPI0039B69869